MFELLIFFLKEEFENMKLKQKEIFIEKKHQELDLKEEKCIKELDQLSQNEKTLCQILTELSMEIIPGKSNNNKKKTTEILKLFI